jgi:hypothetical protein
MPMPRASTPLDGASYLDAKDDEARASPRPGSTWATTSATFGAFGHASRFFYRR